jgi:hypothetical protein
MKNATLLALTASLALVALAPLAQAKLTPRDGLARTTPVDVTSLYAGPVGAEVERAYFTAPTPVARNVGRCTVQAIVFEKTRLAQSCY